ncbi:AraC family transcriptional regulator [Paenibacillus sp. GCM10023252]|uniref:AraC family transcriptional regulator n=1 Tax=Paenibacillus sp. GCM10023252 TaxID=3252649 RepID=UPI0036092FB2
MMVKLRSRKYLLRILASIGVLLAACLILSSITLHFYAEAVLRRNQTESNRSVLAQMTYNMEQMNESVKTLAVSIFYDKDIVPLLRAREDAEEDMYEYTYKRNQLDKLVSRTRHLHSLVIYNDYNKKYYATDSSIAGRLSPMSDTVNAYVSAHPDIPAAQLLPLRMGEDGHTGMFTMFLFEKFANLPTKGSFMAINIRSEWLFDNVKALNSTGEGQVYITDQNHQFILPRSLVALDADLQSAIRKDMQARSKEGTGDFVLKTAEGKYLVSYASVRGLDWKAVRILPLKLVLGGVYQLRLFSVIAAAAFLVLGLILTLLISRRLYDPIDQMLRQMDYPDYAAHPTAAAGAASRSWDEMAYMSRKLVEYKSEQRSHSNLYRQDVLRRLVTEGAKVTKQELAELHEVLGPNSSLAFQGRLLLFEVDHYQAFLRDRTETEKLLLKFALGNIAGELFAGAADLLAVDLDGRYYAGLLVFRAEALEEEQVVRRLHEVQSIYKDFYGCSFTATISEEIRDYREISKHYGLAMEHALYRLKSGHGSVITPVLVSNNMNNHHLQVDAQWEGRLGDELRRGRLEEQQEVLSHIMSELRELPYEGMMHNVLNISGWLATAISDMNRNRLVPVLVDFPSLNRELMECETLSEIQERFNEFLVRIADQASQAGVTRGNLIVDSMKQYIQSHYFDMNLSLQQLSLAMKMSPPSISKLFKQHENKSVPEYINEIRLQKALTFLEETDYTINEITERIGYANETYFFKLFKKRYGTTPKEYRLKVTLK